MAADIVRRLNCPVRLCVAGGVSGRRPRPHRPANPSRPKRVGILGTDLHQVRNRTSAVDRFRDLLSPAAPVAAIL
jgi:hypothetical protein